MRENYQDKILANFANFRVLAEGIKAFLSADNMTNETGFK
jgi:hypothetical protein